MRQRSLMRFRPGSSNSKHDNCSAPPRWQPVRMLPGKTRGARPCKQRPRRQPTTTPEKPTPVRPASSRDQHRKPAPVGTYGYLAFRVTNTP